MKCYYGAFQSLGTWDDHFEGHRVGAVVKVLRPMLFNNLAMASSSLSKLAGVNLDEAFAEGFVNNDPLFKRSVSRYVHADPADAGAPDLVLTTLTKRR